MAPRITQAKKERDAKVRAALKILKVKGLYEGDLRKPLTSYARRKVKLPEFAAVIAGEAQVIKAPKPKDAKKYSGVFTTFKNKVIVPKKQGVARFTQKGELRVAGKAAPPVRMTRKQKPGQKGMWRVAIKSRDGKSETIAFSSDDIKEIHAFIGMYDKITPEIIEIRFEPE